MTSFENQTVGTIAAEKPASVRVFEKLGIDYCCGGQLPLDQACERAGIPVRDAVSLLNEIDARADGASARNWNQATAAELIAHITGTHHSFVRQEIPRIQALLGKVKNRHGAAHAEVVEIEALFLAAAQELQAHLLREEQVLFPYIEKLESAGQDAEPPQACFASVRFPIMRMMADHDDAGELFARIGALSNRYTPPEGVCMSFQALYSGLREFEQDLHQHIHLENNILFPRAIAVEREQEARLAVR